MGMGAQPFQFNLFDAEPIKLFDLLLRERGKTLNSKVDCCCSRLEVLLRGLVGSNEMWLDDGSFGNVKPKTPSVVRSRTFDGYGRPRQTMR